LDDLEVKNRKQRWEMDDMEKRDIDKKDSLICRGCMSLKVSRDKDVSLTQTCHGNPFIDDLEGNEFARCPCEECLLKPMCGEPCARYDTYCELVKGHFSPEHYLKQIKEFDNDFPM